MKYWLWEFMVELNSLCQDSKHNAKIVKQKLVNRV